MRLPHSLLAALWQRIGGEWRWRVVRWRSASFVVGLSGVVRDPAGQVLVLEHRYWAGNPCGLPSGWAEHGETWEAGFAREVREETTLEVTDVEVARVRSGLPGGRVEVLLSARVATGSRPVADGSEVLTARLIPVAQARQVLRADHVRLLDVVLDAECAT